MSVTSGNSDELKPIQASSQTWEKGGCNDLSEQEPEIYKVDVFHSHDLEQGFSFFRDHVSTLAYQPIVR